MKRWTLLIFISLLGIFFCINISDAILIGFDPVTQDVALGNPAIVNLFITDLGNYESPSLGAFDLYVYYDPAILSFSGYTLGPFLGDTMLGDAQDLSWGEISPGTINFSELSLLGVDELNALQPGAFTLASLTFDTIALGSSALHLWYNIGGLSDEYGLPLYEQYDVYLQPGNINVVPEPATFILVGSGLAGIAGVRFLRKKRSR